jgi:predicted ArsR family transcriptional regulator
VQPTRQLILNHLKEHTQATVDGLANVLSLTTVTVRHHLDILRSEGLVAEPEVQRRAARGRPQYLFTLTAKAAAHFPKNYESLAGHLLAEIKAASPRTANVIFEGVAQRFVAEAPPMVRGEPLAARFNRAVAFLNERGYVAHWEKTRDGYVLETSNCPYATLSGEHGELCELDSTLMGRLLGASAECIGRQATGAARCAYRVRE